MSASAPALTHFLRDQALASAPESKDLPKVATPETPPEKTRPVRQRRPCVNRLSLCESLAGLFSIAGWAGLFTLGFIVWSKPFQDVVSNPTAYSTRDVLVNLVWLILTHTLTNVAMLCCLCAVLGTVGRRAHIANDEADESHADINATYVAAIIRGFFVFLAFISGSLLVGGGSIHEGATSAEYVRMAGTTSLFSFLLGYNPHLFRRLRSALNTFADQATVPGKPVTPPVVSQRPRRRKAATRVEVDTVHTQVDSLQTVVRA